MQTFINVGSLSLHQIVFHSNDVFDTEFLNGYTAAPPPHNTVSMGKHDPLYDNKIYDIVPGTQSVKR